MLSEIDSVKNSWRITGQLLPQTLARLTRSVIITSTGPSNRIEGNCLTDQEVETLYQNLKVKKFKTRDQQEIAGYLSTLEFIFHNYTDITISENSIFMLHDNMLSYSDKDLSHRGKYKLSSNRVEAKDLNNQVVGVIFDPTPPYLVKKEMQELIQWYSWAIASKAKHPLILIANFIFEYLAIHPFQDGNGRTSRLLTNLMLMQQDYHFVSIVSHERIVEAYKLDYYLALNKTQASWKSSLEDISPWLLFFLNVVRTQSQEALKILEGDNIDYLLSPKQLALWHWAIEAGEFSRKDAVAAIRFPTRTIEAIIKKLVEMQRLERIGQGKYTRYRRIR